MATRTRRHTAYDSRFYDGIRPGCQQSAAAVVPRVLAALPDVQSVVDVGCGEGWWGQAFADHGAEVWGLDAGDRPQPAPDVDFTHADLAQPFIVDRTFDLAVCLEVAEHLPGQRAEGFVADLCALAPVVLFSAAMPRQGGTGHVNCQPPAYWADLFAAHGYGCDDSLRWQIWEDRVVMPWYRSNLLLFTKGKPGTSPRHVVNPDLWLNQR